MIDRERERCYTVPDEMAKSGSGLLRLYVNSGRLPQSNRSKSFRRAVSEVHELQEQKIQLPN
jgi:hypothetical protein